MDKHKGEHNSIQTIIKFLVFLITLTLQIVILLLVYKGTNNLFIYSEVIFDILKVFSIIYIIHKPINPSYKLTWIVLIAVLPVLGIVMFLLFGNVGIPKMLKKTFIKNKELSQKFLNYKKEDYMILKEMDIYKYKQACFLTNVSDYPLYRSNNIEYLDIGEKYLEKLLIDLKKAEKYIFLEYFIIEPGIFLNSIIDILEQKVKDGVDVRLIYDDFGSLPTFSQKNVYQLKTRGIKCISFNPLFFIKGTLNNRDHRKILIIDGNVAFSGGINLADEYINKKKKYGHWKDIGFKLTGTPVKSYNYMFIEFWNAFSNEKIDSNIINECLSERKNENGYIISYYDSPAYKEHISNNLYIDLLSQAINYAWFYTPYLIIGDFLMDALIKAAERGVDVRIFIPGIPDKKIVYRLSKSYYAPLLKAGIKIFEYTPGFIHAKACLIDDNIGTIGTVNLDYRSLFLHFECNSLFYKSSILDELKIDMIETQKKCKEVKEKDIKKGYFHRVFDAILRIFAPLC